MSRPRRILVVRTDRLGDVVLATPLVRALRATFPDAYLAALVRPYAGDVLAGNPHLDAILTDDRDGADHGTRGFWRRVAALRRHRFDTALLLMPTSRAAWMLFCAGIPRRIGVGRKFYEVVTGMQSVSRHGYVPLRHEADYCLDLGRRIGVRSADLDTEIFLGDDERRRGARILAAAGATAEHLLVGIHMGSGGSSPNWSSERYLELARAVLDRAPPAVRIVLSGEDRAPTGLASDRVFDLRGARPLRDFVTFVSRLHVLVSSSTGPMHIAAALRVPTVSLFCPLPACSPDLWGPRGNRARIVSPPAGDCGVRCPGDPKVCRFENIAVAPVAEAVLESLDRTSNRPLSPPAPSYRAESKEAPDRRSPGPRG